MQLKTNEQVSGQVSDTCMVRDKDVPKHDQMGVLSPYFKYFEFESNVSLYFASSSLGDPRVRLLYWQGKPAAHGSLFPFPFWVDGKQVIGGRTEAAAVHRDVLGQRGRPDLFGVIMDELLSEARAAGWSLLITKPNILGRMASSKKGFRNVAMPVMDLYWPLSAAAFVPRALDYVGRRYPKLSKAMPGPLLRGAIAGALNTLTAITKITTSVGASVYELTELPMEDLTRYSALVEKNYWTDRRITLWREPKFLQDRLQVKPGYKLIGVWSRAERKVVALAIVCSEEGGLSLLDVLPARVALEREFWREMIRYAMRVRAKALRTHLYLNNPVHEAVARQLYLKMAAHSGKGDDIFSVLALEPKYAFAYDPNTWAGSDMLIVGF